jgi:hypothetical protein
MVLSVVGACAAEPVATADAAAWRALFVSGSSVDDLRGSSEERPTEHRKQDHQRLALLPLLLRAPWRPFPLPPRRGDVPGVVVPACWAAAVVAAVSAPSGVSMREVTGVGGAAMAGALVISSRATASAAVLLLLVM